MSKTTTKQPECLEDCKAYREAREKLNDLMQQRDEKSAAAEDLQQKLRLDHTHEVDLEAEHLRNGTLKDYQADQKSLVALSHELQVYERAVRQQEDVVSAEMRKASAAVRATRLDEHKQLAFKIREAVEALRDALLAEVIFRDDMDRSDVPFGEPMKPVAFPRLGDPRDNDSAIAYYLREFPYQENGK